MGLIGSTFTSNHRPQSNGGPIEADRPLGLVGMLADPLGAASEIGTNPLATAVFGAIEDMAGE